MGIKDSTEEQQEHNAEDDKGKHVVVTVVEQQKHKSQNDGGAYPDNLHT